MTDGQQLLADYAATGSETAFRDLVGRYVDLVYSAAVRLVNDDSHLAEDVTQTVFADLARKARSLSSEVMVGGWLHRHTVFVASKIMRGERRRQARERQAVEMNAIEDHSAANLAMVSPVLDDAINQLGAEDRAAIMLRFFEQRDFRSVGEAMGGSEDAARKRVDRALGKLETMLKRRGVALSAAAIGTTLGTSAVSAAPAGLATGIATAALATAATAAGGGTALTLLKIMTITKAKAAVIGAIIVVAGVAIPLAVSHQKEATKLRAENEALRKQQAEEIQQLQDEQEKLLTQIGRANAAAGAQRSTNDLAREVLRLRGEVGKLRQEKADIAASKTNGPSMMSELRKNPDMWKMIRDQQKLGIAMMYGKFTKDAKLSKEQGEKFNDVLTDFVMDNVDRISEVMRDGKTGQEYESVFAGEEMALQEKLKELLGVEVLSQYQDYTRNLTGSLTAEQFKEKMTGDKAAKDEKVKQLRQLMQEETQAALASAGLPADFQTLPIMNFRNFPSEAEGDKNLKLLESIYGKVAARAGSFLSADELKNFAEFRATALSNNRMGLLMNRKMMAPGSN